MASNLLLCSKSLEAAMRYTIILERDPAGLVVAHVPALKGCALYIETLIEHGRHVPTESGREIVELTVVGK
jgi:predicted RNase H-like HicB family nuclease